MNIFKRVFGTVKPSALVIQGNKPLGFVRCPSCSREWIIDEHPLVLRGSAFLVDACAGCGAHILIENAGLFLLVEAFRSEPDLQRVVTERTQGSPRDRLDDALRRAKGLPRVE